MATALLGYLRLPILAVTGLTTIASGLLYWKQNELIYPRFLPQGARTEEGVPKPSQFGISDAQDLRLITPDGETLHAIFIRPSNKAHSRPTTIIVFHGNAGNIGHRLPIAKVLEESTGCSVLMVEYRGYGLSTGSPDEKGLNVDAQTALDWVRQADECRGHEIVIYGQSLGGAVATQLVARNLMGTSHEGGDIKALILENTFTSIRKLIPTVIPPARYIVGLCHQTWETEAYLPKITDVPILFLSGLKDEIVPPSHMKELRSICRSKDVVWRDFPNGTHNESVMEADYFLHIARFIESRCGGQS